MSRKAGKVNEILDTLKQLDLHISDLEMNDSFILELITGAKTIPDPRHPSYVRHQLKEPC